MAQDVTITLDRLVVCASCTSPVQVVIHIYVTNDGLAGARVANIFQ